MQAAGFWAAGCWAAVPDCLAKCRPGVNENAGKGSYLAVVDTRGTSSGVWNIYRRMEHRGAHGPTSLMHSVQQKAVSEPKLKEVADFCPAK